MYTLRRQWHNGNNITKEEIRVRDIAHQVSIPTTHHQDFSTNNKRTARKVGVQDVSDSGPYRGVWYLKVGIAMSGACMVLNRA